MHDLCRAEFTGTHFCSSLDIIRNGAQDGALPVILAAWVHPSIRGYTDLEVEGLSPTIVDASGAREFGPLVTLSCVQWGSTNGELHFGMSITPEGR